VEQTGSRSLPARFIGLSAQKTKVATRNLDAVRHLPRDDAEAVLDEFQILDFEAVDVVEVLTQHLHEAEMTVSGPLMSWMMLA